MGLGVGVQGLMISTQCKQNMHSKSTTSKHFPSCINKKHDTTSNLQSFLYSL